MDLGFEATDFWQMPVKNLLSPLLNYICRVAELGSIRHASEHLHVSASAINRQIINLEAQLGMPIFERLPRGVRLTEAGKSIYDTIKTFESQSTACLSRLSTSGTSLNAHVTLGVLQSFAEEAIPEVVEDLNIKETSFSYKIKINTTREIVADVLKGDLDLGLCWEPHFQVPVEIIRSYAMRIGVIMPPGHPLDNQSELTIEDCLEYPLILPSEDMEFRSVVDRLSAFKTFRLRPFVEVNSTSVMRDLAIRRVGIAFVMRYTARKELKAGRLVYRELSHSPQQSMGLVLFARKGRTLSPGLKEFVSHLTSRLDAMLGH